MLIPSLKIVLIGMSTQGAALMKTNPTTTPEDYIDRLTREMAADVKQSWIQYHREKN
jgi:hypothetical protein